MKCGSTFIIFTKSQKKKKKKKIERFSGFAVFGFRSL